MKNLILISFVVIFSGCTTARRCALKFPNTASYDSIYIQKLDTIKLVIPGDSVKIVTKVPCDDFELITENGKLTSALRVVNGILSQRINIKPDTIYKYKTNTVTVTREVKVPEKVKYVPKFTLFMSRLGILLSILIVAYLGFKIRSKLI